MPGRPYLLAETTWKTVRETHYEVAVLPWGATEAHNFHLPYATDTWQCDAVAAQAAAIAWERGARVVVLPTIPFGVNTGQLDIRLDINMNPSTQALVLRDVVDSLSRQGVPKLVVMNGHGGNDFRQMIRELQPRYPGVFLCQVHWYAAAPWDRFFEDLGEHAGELETSVMMHVAPDLVLPLEQAGSGTEHRFTIEALRERWVWAQREWSRATADTGIGNPAKATADKGRRFLEVVTDRLADFLVELDRTAPENLYET